MLKPISKNSKKDSINSMQNYHIEYQDVIKPDDEEVLWSGINEKSTKIIAGYLGSQAAG
jgi:hypothetical protein